MLLSVCGNLMFQLFPNQYIFIKPSTEAITVKIQIELNTNPSAAKYPLKTISIFLELR